MAFVGVAAATDEEYAPLLRRHDDVYHELLGLRSGYRICPFSRLRLPRYYPAGKTVNRPEA